MAKQAGWTRRAVLHLAWVGIVASAALTLKPLASYLTSKEGRGGSPLVLYDTPLAEISGWQNTASNRVWVKRDALGVTAIIATCTHLGCEVSYHADKQEWLCPCHSSVYDEEGRVLAGPAPEALHRAVVQRKADGSLLIDSSRQVGMDVRI